VEGVELLEPPLEGVELLEPGLEPALEVHVPGCDGESVPAVHVTANDPDAVKPSLHAGVHFCPLGRLDVQSFAFPFTGTTLDASHGLAAHVAVICDNSPSVQVTVNDPDPDAEYPAVHASAHEPPLFRVDPQVPKEYPTPSFLRAATFEVSHVDVGVHVPAGCDSVPDVVPAAQFNINDPDAVNFSLHSSEHEAPIGRLALQLPIFPFKRVILEVSHGSALHVHNR